ncbi:DUF429 domain-containing protein [Fundidesulfovibrio agrisoli]|uniref:DUF429 domain-containing protein n=1 Tax=Fundidesulfovibrio agrisoli TaxID=2922717 RepID=UPI001FADC7D1|nr:DUF429 domain-containing protein [Fundidesulfovibrio agrisoli]
MGLDAAWTPANPWGVALAVDDGGGWRLVLAAPDMAGFMGGTREGCEPGAGTGARSDVKPGARSDVKPGARADAKSGAGPGAGAEAEAEARPETAMGTASGGSPSSTDALAQAAQAPEPEALLARCRELAGVEPQCVAVDMPIVPNGRVTGRRAADNAVSRAFGGRKCATHSPTQERPGALGENFSRGLEGKGYHVAVAGSAPTGRDLLEVYPHPALLALTGERMRLPYKSGKTNAYWPGLPRAERAARLLAVWARIREALAGRMVIEPGVLPPPDGWRLKAWEDMLDAAICAWVGACWLDGAATAYGDAASAVWVPEGV